MNQACTVWFLGACAALTGCSPGSAESSLRRVLHDWTASALSDQGDFERRAAALAGTARAFCSAPAPEALSATQAEWWSARAPWKRTEVFAFGPVVDEPLRLGPKIDFWPARPDTIEAILKGSEPLSAETVAALPAPARGLPVIEYLLYQPAMVQESLFVAESRRCQYLVAVTDDVAGRAHDLRAAWDPTEENFAGQVTAAGRGSARFMSVQSAINEIINRIGFTMENIRVDKLNKPVGATAGVTVDPDTPESRFSGRSLQDIRDNVVGIERLFFGFAFAGGEATPPGGSGAGGTEPSPLSLDAFLRSIGRDFSLEMRTRLSRARAALDAVPQPLTAAVTADPAAVLTASASLKEVQRLIQVDVSVALGVSVGFNDNDGD